MRRLNDERGATAVIVALLMTSLLAVAALVVDFGALHVERRELQNGADAAALALAEDCARRVLARCGSQTQRETWADTWLDANASDGDSHLVGVSYDEDDRRITVWARSKDPGSGRLSVPMRFASVLGVRSKAVRAHATASWGPPRTFPTKAGGGRHPSIPLAIDACEFAEATNGGVKFYVPVVIVFHNGGGAGGGSALHPCASNASGQDSPGNFGWIASTTDCAAGISEIGKVGGDNGNSPPGACSPTEIRARVGTDIVLPIFDKASGTGSHATYEISGWGAFHLTGFKLHGSSDWEHPASNPPCSGGDRCIAGWFVPLSAAAAPPGGKPYGVSMFGLVGTPDDVVAPEEPAEEPEGHEEEPTTTTVGGSDQGRNGGGNRSQEAT